MATLTVKNVGPIREAHLDVKKHTLFIGPQGSGKSTLAKLIAIGGDREIFPNYFHNQDALLTKYNLDNFISDTSIFDYNSTDYSFLYNREFDFRLSTPKEELLTQQIISYYTTTGNSVLSLESFKGWLPAKREQIKMQGGIGDIGSIIYNFYDTFFRDNISFTETIYLPAERSLFPVLSNAIWSLINSNVNLPKILTFFGREFENARNTLNRLNISFLDVHYERRNGQDFIEYRPNQFINLSESASGYQSIIPLFLVVEHQRQQSQRRFIIEEPELNLYPTAQKDLIYSLIGGLQPDVEYKDAEWVITTHSPYVLSSLNTLILAYKVAQRSDELRIKVKELVPERCWINPDEFAAYYVDNGTVRSIISEKTGLIDENELDDVSDALADEQEALFDLYRSIPQLRA